MSVIIARMLYQGELKKQLMNRWVYNKLKCVHCWASIENSICLYCKCNPLK